MKPAAAVIAALVIAVLLLGGGAYGIANASSTCTTTALTANRAEGLGTIAGYSGEQLVNASTIVAATQAQHAPARAVTIVVSAAMTLSGLRNVDDDTDRLGLFREDPTAGDTATRLDPAAATGRFLARIQSIDGWQTIAPGVLAHAVEPVEGADAYADTYAAAAAVVSAVTSAASSCQIPDDQISLAQELVTAADHGHLHGLVPDHIKEIRWIAQGKSVPNCEVDTRVLQIIALAVRAYGDVGVSSINRKCTGELIGGRAGGSHWGGHAVDFYALGGHALTGADSRSLAFIALLDPLLPDGARFGQSNCRSAAGVPVALQHATQFPDFCNHLHVDVAYTRGALAVTGVHN